MISPIIDSFLQDLHNHTVEVLKKEAEFNNLIQDGILEGLPWPQVAWDWL